jgi:hypothetical protein
MPFLPRPIAAAAPQPMPWRPWSTPSRDSRSLASKQGRHLTNRHKLAQPLRLLRLHSILCLEVFSWILDELSVAWMIDGFHSDDDFHQLGIVVVNVLDQFGLCIGGSRDKHRTGVYN